MLPLKDRQQSGASGQGLVEYALILVLVAVVTIVIVGLLGQQIQSVFCDALMGLGDHAPRVSMCEAPRVQCAGIASGTTVTSPFSIEAIVTDNQGPGSIDRVEFLIDGTYYRTEYVYRYCLGSGDATCGLYNPAGLSPGTHTITAIAYDADGHTGQCSIQVVRP